MDVTNRGAVMALRFRLGWTIFHFSFIGVW